MNDQWAKRSFQWRARRVVRGSVMMPDLASFLFQASRLGPQPSHALLLSTPSDTLFKVTK